jgi:membrane-bound lytic murein transglycosylase D
MKKRLVKYVVKRGDSLWKIAAKFGTTTKIIRRLNYLKSNYLKAGQTLLVPKAAKERKA